MFQQLGQKKGTKLKLNKYKRISPEFDWITEFICSSSFDPVLIVYCVELTQYGIKKFDFISGPFQTSELTSDCSWYPESYSIMPMRHSKMLKLLKNLSKSQNCIK